MSMQQMMSNNQSNNNPYGYEGVFGKKMSNGSVLSSRKNSVKEAINTQVLNSSG